MRERAIIELDPWLQSPPGAYLRAWEQAQLDLAVSDVFGFHALQMGVGQIDALRANRMPHRWLANDARFDARPQAAPALQCDFDALPFPNQSLDLVVLPHALELARDAHDTLREVERVLVPEGRVIVTGLNPTSLWALRQHAGHLRRRLGLGGRPYLPRSGGLIGYWRLRDWLRLLGFEVEVGRFGCWRPPFNSARWLQRWGWIEATGERWWPVLGALYFVVAVKRVRGMRLVGLARRGQASANAAAPAVAAHRVRDRTEGA